MPKRPTFTDEEQKALNSVMNRTWEEIGADVLVNDMGEPDYGKSIPRSHVIELVLDADRLRDYAHSGIEKAVVDRFYKLASYSIMKRIAAKAFPYSRYGW